MTEAKVLKYSADYPGFLKNKVEAELATKCVFMQGASGDMSPNVGSGPPGPKGFGQTLADHVIALARSAKTEVPAHPVGQGNRRHLSLQDTRQSQRPGSRRRL